MKNTSPYVLKLVWAFLLAGILAQCADPNTTDKLPPKASQQTATDKEEKPAPKPTATTQERTQELVTRFEGNYAKMEQALKTVATPNLALDDIEGYDLANPKIQACEGDCCTVTFEAGLTARTYRFCWQGDKLAQVIYTKK